MSAVRISSSSRADDNNNEYKYKIGGTLIINKSPNYIVLTNGKKNWSVQLKQHIIFREISVDKLRQQYERLLNDKNRTIEELKYLIQEYKKKSCQSDN